MTQLYALLAGLVLWVASLVGVGFYEHHQGAESVQADWDKAKAVQTAQLLKDTLANQELERKDRANTSEALNAAHQSLAALAVAHSGLVSSGDRLQQRLVAACFGPGARDPAATPRGLSASSPGDLYADVQRRLDEAATATAGFADATRVAAITCVKSYPVTNK